MDIAQETRRNSYEQISLVANIRKKLILGVLSEYGELTAQEIAITLFSRGHIPSDERNFTAPRITELCKDGRVKSVDKKLCVKTGRKVTVWALQIK